MKKIFSIFAASLMLFAASCSTEKLDEPTGDGNVTFTVQLPGGLQSRAEMANGNGLAATKLHYWVYETGQTTPLAAGLVNGEPKTADFTNLQATAELQLVTGKQYDVVFWAQAPDAPYTFDLNARTVAMNYTAANANDEKRDAFFKVETITVTGSMTQNVTLTRPFAQLNFATSDMAAAQSAGFILDKTAVKVTSIKPTFQLIGNGTAIGDDTDVTFAATEIPEGDLTIQNEAYKCISMNYLLVEGENTLVNCTLTKNADVQSYDLEVSNVPVKRNYRTNIYGALLTSTTNFNVEISPAFNTPDENIQYVNSTSQLQTVLNNGSTSITNPAALGKNLTGTVTVEQNSEAVLNLAGRTLTFEGSAINPAPAVGLRDATISSVNAAIIVKGKLTIIGEGKVDGQSNTAVNVAAGGTLIVQGGTYTGGTDIVITQEENANVQIEGGSFEGFNPESNLSEGYDCYSTTENEKTTYHVIEGTAVETADEFVAAMQAGGDVKVVKSINISNSGVVYVKANTNLDVANGVTIDTQRQGSYANIVVNSGISLHITGEGTFASAVGDDQNSNRIIDVNGELIVDGCTFITTSHIRGSAISPNPGSKVIFNKGVINAAACAIWNDGGDVTINGGSISSTSSTRFGDGCYSYTIRCYDQSGTPAKLTINGGEFTGVQGVIALSAWYDTVSAVINGGTFKAVADIDGSKARTFYAVYCAYGSSCVINGGKFSSVNEYFGPNYKHVCVLNSDEDDPDGYLGTVTIRGGKFSEKALDVKTGGNKNETALPKGYSYRAISDGDYKYEVVAE